MAKTRIWSMRHGWRDAGEWLPSDDEFEETSNKIIQVVTTPLGLKPRGIHGLKPKVGKG